MKHLFLTLLMSITALSFAQKAEPVYSIAKEQKEVPWYKEQLDLWKKELDKNNQNGNAWINFYRANRALKIISETQADKESYQKACLKIISDLKITMPNSFEYYFISYSENGVSAEPADLLQAEKIRPLDPNIQDLLMIHYETIGDVALRNKYANHLLEQNDMSTLTLNWGYNILSELDENAILLTAGDNDTYAAWVIQGSKGFRPDVTVINTSLILLDSYRAIIFKKLGIPAYNLPVAKTNSEYIKGVHDLYQHILKHAKSVYFASTCVGNFQSEYEDKLYLAGLSYKYSETTIDNLPLIKRNYEKRYLLDYLTVHFTNHIGDKQAEYFNSTYLPSMIKLYQYYSESEDLNQKASLKPIIFKIAEQSGQLADVLQLLEK